MIKLYKSRKYAITLDELKSFYEIYIKDANINETNQDGDTMLKLAVYFKEYDIISFLVDIPGINLNDKYSMRNPLFLAIDKLDYSMIDFILSLNESHPIIDVNIKNDIGETPLFALYRQMEKHVDEGENIIEMFKKLIDMGADKDAKNYIWKTLLQQAKYNLNMIERHEGIESRMKILNIREPEKQKLNLKSLITYLE